MGTGEIASGVEVSGGVKLNWGKSVVDGEPTGVPAGSKGVTVEAVCIAANVFAASVENSETLCVEDVGLVFGLVTT
jgi:hypothetical protein